MPISTLKYIKYIKTLRHVSISTDHNQGVCLYLVKVIELFKNTEFKIMKIIPGVVAAKRVAGISGDPCGAVRLTHSTTRVTTYSCYTFL